MCAVRAGGRPPRAAGRRPAASSAGCGAARGQYGHLSQPARVDRPQPQRPRARQRLAGAVSHARVVRRVRTGRFGGGSRDL